jgi:hypothetical protein
MVTAEADAAVTGAGEDEVEVGFAIAPTVRDLGAVSADAAL